MRSTNNTSLYTSAHLLSQLAMAEGGCKSEKTSFYVAFKLKVVEEAKKLPIEMLASQPDDEDDDPFANLDEPNNDENELETNELVIEDND